MKKDELTIWLLNSVILTVLSIKFFHMQYLFELSSFELLVVIFGILFISLLIFILMKLFFKKLSILSISMFSVSAASLGFIINLSSPKLVIIVPKGYTGEVCLVLSNCETNILTIDSNGIGYINKSTFDNTYTKPTILEVDSSDITDRSVGFNPSTFWAKGSFSSTSAKSQKVTNEIHFLSFEIVPAGKEGQKQYYSVDLDKLIDHSKLCNNP